MAKLWQKNYTLNELIEAFTVGQDYLIDRDLLPADAVASVAQARQLAAIGLLTVQEQTTLSSALFQIIGEWRTGTLTVNREDEDCHTAIENRLVQLCGEVGKKIHTGRSRNDQVLTALRVWARSAIDRVAGEALGLVADWLNLAERHRLTPMPGRTHLQTGMPSSVGLWAGAWAEGLLDDLELLKTAYFLVDQSPLGSAASYGVPLPLDREYSARLLGFSRVQNNVLGANNSRGKIEAVVLDALDMVGLSLSKMAQDLILFSLPEFGYFHLPAALCSGSSIMPQKKNPDGLELMRAKSASLSAWAMQVKGILRSLPSGYNRDFQETKEPFFRGLTLARDCLAVMRLTVKELEVDESALRRGFTPDIFATDAAYELVKSGLTFRDAYREVGLHLERLDSRDPASAIENRTHEGAAGNLGLEKAWDRHREYAEHFAQQRNRVETSLKELVGPETWEASGL
ncbi:MAG: argininosuccinate lyase [Spirochaetales bacterium]|nr:argininosuccinate lyase [Spirochaetales bacterium]